MGPWVVLGQVAVVADLLLHRLCSCSIVLRRRRHLEKFSCGGHSDFGFGLGVGSEVVLFPRLFLWVVFFPC